MKQHLKLILGILVSLVFLYLAFREFSLSDITVALGRMNGWLLPVGVGLFFVDVYLICIRWSYQLRVMKQRKGLSFSHPVSAVAVVPSVAMGYFGNNVFPARMGEFFRAFSWDRKTSMGKSAILATIVIERIFDGLAMVSIAVVSSLFFELSPSMTSVIQLSAGLFIVLLGVAFVVVLHPQLSERLLDTLVSHIPHEGLQKSLKHFYHAFLDAFALLPNFKSIAILYLLSVANWFFEGTVYYVTALAFGIELPLYVFTFTAAITSLTTLIPSAPGYVGTFHYVVKETLGLFAVPAQIAASYSIVVHLVLWLPITLIGGFFAWYEGVKKE